MSLSAPDRPLPPFNKPKHVTYWLRCLKTFLPWQYTSNDSNRMMLAYFTLSALDLLSSLESSTTPIERADYANWIYSCQHPKGGFRGFPGTDFGDRSNESNSVWDPANVPATYFALTMLLILRDDMTRVKRTECLAWLAKMQRPDGSFGQTLGVEEGQIEGGTDTRFAYTAIGIRWILSADAGSTEDVNVENLVQCIKELQSYDGGMADSPFHESHGGFTCCAISALSFLGRIPDGIRDKSLLLRWLISKQTTVLDEDDEYLDEVGPAPTAAVTAQETDNADNGSTGICVGFSGRCNKTADTCYSWWVCSTLVAMGKLDLINTANAQRYLLEKTQHLIGGFGKLPDYPPDLYHSYLGLAALSLLGQPGVKQVHPAACISQEACQYLETLPWKSKPQ